MSIWEYSASPAQNQYMEGMDFHEGQTTSTVPASLRKLMQQMAEYANLQRILPLSGKTENLSVPINIPPQEFLCSIAPAASGVKGNIVFILNTGEEIKTDYPRANYSGNYIVRFPEGVITSTESKNVPTGTICHFWEKVPAGWQDITDKYKGRYIEGSAPSEAGKTFPGAMKSHGHSGQSGDMLQNKTVHMDFQSPTPRTVHAGNAHGGVNVGQVNRGGHGHKLELQAEGGDTPKPMHIVLRLGRKL